MDITVGPITRSRRRGGSRTTRLRQGGTVPPLTADLPMNETGKQGASTIVQVITIRPCGHNAASVVMMQTPASQTLHFNILGQTALYA